MTMHKTVSESVIYIYTYTIDSMAALSPLTIANVSIKKPEMLTCERYSIVCYLLIPTFLHFLATLVAAS